MSDTPKNGNEAPDKIERAISSMPHTLLIYLKTQIVQLTLILGAYENMHERSRDLDKVQILIKRKLSQISTQELEDDSNKSQDELDLLLAQFQEKWEEFAQETDYENVKYVDDLSKAEPIEDKITDISFNAIIYLDPTYSNYKGAQWVDHFGYRPLVKFLAVLLGKTVPENDAERLFVNAGSYLGDHIIESLEHLYNAIADMEEFEAYGTVDHMHFGPGSGEKD